MRDSPSKYVSLDHLVFYRHWLEGINDLGKIASRYLETGANEPAAKRALARIQAALVDACRRRGKHGQAALLALPRDRIAQKKEEAAPSDIPSFEQFQAQYDPNGHFSLNELLDIYGDFYGQTSKQEPPKNRFSQRDQRLRERRLALINDLAHIVAASPRGDDQVDGWFDRTVAQRLHQAGIYTLAELCGFMNHHGYRYFTKIPRVGPIMGDKLREFAQRHSETIGVALSAYASKPRSTMTRDDLEAVQALQSQDETIGALTYRKLIKGDQKERPAYCVAFGGFPLPTDLDGSRGSNRASSEKNKLTARDDFAAVQEWLVVKQGNWLTYRAYAREAQRLHAWALMEKHLALSDLTSAHLSEYRYFLADPQPRIKWVATRKYERFHPAWRPFVARTEQRPSIAEPGKMVPVLVYGLSDLSIKQAMTILKNLFNWLTGQRYLDSNPLDGLPNEKRYVDVQVERNLTQRQWQYLLDYARRLPEDDPNTARTRFTLHLAYSTGMRLAELSSARLGDIIDPGFSNGFESARQLEVRGKGKVLRKIPLPTSLLASLARYLESRALAEQCIGDKAYSNVPLISKLPSTDNPQATREPISSSVLYKYLKRFFKHASESIPANLSREINPHTLLQASTHWLRHSHGSHALARGASLTTVKANLGHKSLQTTSLYLHSEDLTRQQEMERFDQQVFGED